MTRENRKRSEIGRSAKIVASGIRTAGRRATAPDRSRWGCRPGRSHWTITLACVITGGVLAFAAGFLLRGHEMLTQRPSAFQGGANAADSALSKLLSERTLHAASATSDESFAIAVGSIDSDIEGLFILDFVTGQLQCVTLNHRSGRFAGIFQANVFADLNVEGTKRPRFLISSGMINFPRGAAAIARPANSVIYVLDTTTGNYAAYGVPWRREFSAAGRPQSGPLTLIDVGQSRTAALRE